MAQSADQGQPSFDSSHGNGDTGALGEDVGSGPRLIFLKREAILLGNRNPA
jgi:hypothetical protein